MSDVTSTEARKGMTEKLVKAMGGRRWCSSCRNDQSLEGGLSTKYRWICQFCLARRKK